MRGRPPSFSPQQIGGTAVSGDVRRILKSLYHGADAEGLAIHFQTRFIAIMIREHDRVVLTVALSDERLEPGDVGVVVHVHPRHEAYEVAPISSSIQVGAWSLAWGRSRTQRSTPALRSRGASPELSNR